MPWVIADVPRHVKGLDAKQSAAWIKIANKALADCMAKGGTTETCEGKAIRIANAMAKQVTEEQMTQRGLDALLLEAAAGTEAVEEDIQERVDANARRVVGDVVYGVAALRGKSSNGRVYPTETMQAAVPLFEGRAVYANHSKAGRDVRDLVGVLREARFEGDGIRADLHVLKSSAAWLLEVAEKAPEALGLSINGKGRVTDGIVEEIRGIRSVDVVAEPATVSGLFESKSETEEAEMKELEEAKARTVALTEERDTLAEKVKTLEESAAKAKAETERKDAVDKMLSEAKLPEEAITEGFRSTLEGLEPEAAKALITERAALVNRAKSGTPVSKEQKLFEEEGGKPTIEEYEAAIRG